MKLNTQSQFQSKLDTEFAWRLKEIADLKTAIRTSESFRRRTLVRAGVTLLYAHWEGFVKTISEDYLHYVSNQRHNYSELRSCFVAYGLKSTLDEIASTSSAKRNTELINKLIIGLNTRATFTPRGIVNTESNLSSTVFTNIAVSIGLDPANYSTYFNFIDESILSKRNSIAHGEDVGVDGEAFPNLADNMILIMRMFKSDIENALVLRSYKL